MGIKWRTDIDFTGHLRTWYVGPAVQNIEDLDLYVIPDPFEPERWMQSVFSQAKSEGLVPAETFSAGLLDLILGIEKTSIGFYKYPTILDRCTERLLKYNIEIAKSEIDEGIEIIITSGSYALLRTQRSND